MRVANYNAAVARLLPLVLCIALPLATRIAWSLPRPFGAPADSAVTTTLLICSVVAVVAGGIPALIMPFFAVFWVEAGEALRVRTLFGTKRFEWRDVQLDFQEVQMLFRLGPLPIDVPGPKHLLAVFHAKGRAYRVKIAASQRAELQALAAGGR